MTLDIVNGIYKHHKGGLYAVLGLARLSTNGPHDGEKVVIYYSLDKQQLCVREIGQFNEPVEWPDGKVRSRFAPLSSTGAPT